MYRIMLTDLVVVPLIIINAILIVYELILG